MRARLIRSREIGPEVREFLFEAMGVETLEFTPGQFVSFSSTHLGRPVTRAYSIASAPNGNRFELCLNRVKEGLLSPWLFGMAPGAEIEMQGPLGYFGPRQPFRDSLLVATGTGIAPFRSFLMSGQVLDSGARITLLFGARYEAGLVYRELFEDLAKRRPGFLFLPTVTRPAADWTGRTGRVQQHLEEALAGRKDIDVYLCGLKAMVDDVRTLLKQRGFDRKQIIVEKYD